jgi:hypothetical protein
VRCAVENIAGRSFNFLYDIFAVSDILKGETAVICGFGCEDRLGTAGSVETDGRTAETAAALVLLDAVNTAVDKLVGNALSVVGF